MTAGASRWGRSGPVRVATAIGLALAGVALVWVAVVPSPPDPHVVRPPTAPGSSSVSPSVAADPTRRPSARREQTDVRDRVSGPLLPESDPLTVSIPRIGVRSRLVELGLDQYGVMEVPVPPSRAGWFSRGATPGALGPAVIAGHVTWDGAPSVFHRLGTLRRGDQVSVTRKDGRTAVFTVNRVARYPKSRFPSEAVYGAIDHAGLRLITCGGTYDAAERSYVDNVVVFAKLETARRSRDR